MQGAGCKTLYSVSLIHSSPKTSSALGFLPASLLDQDGLCVLHFEIGKLVMAEAGAPPKADLQDRSIRVFADLQIQFPIWIHINHNSGQKKEFAMSVSHASIRCIIRLALVALLVLPDIAGAAPVETPAPPALNLVIVEGEGAINNVRQRTAREPIVQVEDENHKPGAGAVVLFMLPDNGPSGTFGNSARTLKVVTDNQGRAAAKGFRANRVSGKYQIRVEASYQGMSANLSITQTNAVLSTAAMGLTGKVIAVLAGAAIGGAAVAGAVFATRTGSKPTTITPGKPSVGGF